MNNILITIFFFLLLSSEMLAQSKLELKKSEILYQNDTMQIIQTEYGGLIDTNNVRRGTTRKWVLYDVSKSHKNDTIRNTFSAVISLKSDGKYMSTIMIGLGHAFSLKEKTAIGWTNLAYATGGAFYDKYTKYEMIHTGLFSFEESYDRRAESQDMLEQRGLARAEFNKYQFNLEERKIIKYQYGESKESLLVIPVEIPFPIFSKEEQEDTKTKLNQQIYH